VKEDSAVEMTRKRGGYQRLISVADLIVIRPIVDERDERCGKVVPYRDSMLTCNS
jgi:hypothetical protein